MSRTALCWCGIPAAQHIADAEAIEEAVRQRKVQPKRVKPPRLREYRRSFDFLDALPEETDSHE